MKYRHVVLTIPEQLREVFYKYRHNGKILSELMRTGYRCVEEVVGTAVKRKVKIGMIMVLQTHGRSGHYNPHLHILLTSGGINEERKEWKELGYCLLRLSIRNGSIIIEHDKRTSTHQRDE